MKRRTPSPKRSSALRVTAMLLSLLMLLSVVTAIPAVAATDNATYEVGTVLHNINFTTMTAATGKEAIAKATGYFIAASSTDDMNIGTEGWTINGKDHTGYTDITFTNANIPENLNNYTVSVTFRWKTGNSVNQRVELVHDYSINSSTNKTSNMYYTGTTTTSNQTITPNGQFRYMNNANGTYTNFEDAELKTVLSAADNRFVEVKCSYVDKKIEKIYFIYTASDTTTKTVEMTPDNVGVANPYFMFRVRQTADVVIKGIQVVSGSAAEQSGKNLIWPQGQQPDSIVNTTPVEVEETNLYYQRATSLNADGTVDVRFITVIDTLDYDQVGFKIQISRTDAHGVTTTSNEVTKATTQVFESINALGETVTAEELGGKYIVAVVITGINCAEYENVINVTAFVQNGETPTPTATGTFTLETTAVAA